MKRFFRVALVKTLKAPLAILLLAALACSGEKPPPGHILVKNDSQDSAYNVISVSGGGRFASLRPGERVILPANTKSFSVQRRYKDYTRSYSVSCPPLNGKGIVIKLIDIHVNRIAGGCVTTSANKN
ncbi:MAG: hypothetical protein ACK5Y6_09160 [Pseudomonadota bacterium]